MSGRKRKAGEPHIEFRCRYCSSLLGVGTLIDGALAVVSATKAPRRGWPNSPTREGRLYPPDDTAQVWGVVSVRSCLKHNALVGGTIPQAVDDPDFLSMTVENCAVLPVEKCAVVVGMELRCLAGRCRL